MRGTRVILAFLAVAMAMTVAGALALRDAMKARPPTAASAGARAGAVVKKARPKFRTLGDLMAANYGWKPPTPASEPKGKGGGGQASTAAPSGAHGQASQTKIVDAQTAEALARAVADDDVCAVDRLLPRAGKDAAVAAFLEHGQSRMLAGPEEDALRALLDPKAKAETIATGAALQGLRFLDALERAGFLRRPNGNASQAARPASSPLEGWRGLEELASEDGGNGAYELFLAPAQLAAGREPREVRHSVARAIQAPRFETGLPEILELLAKQGLASASHFYLSTYLRASVPLPNWSAPMGLIQRLLRRGDPDLERSVYEFGERLQREALIGFERSPAARRWHESQLAAGNDLVELAWPRLSPGTPAPDAPLPPAEPREAASAILDAIRALGRDGQPCDRSPMDRAVRDERGRLRL